MSRIQDVAHLRRLIPEPPSFGGKNAGGSKVLDHLEEQSLAFLSECRFMLLASCGPNGIEISPKGDEVGFLRVEDSRTILIPERHGNGLAFGFQNVIADNRVGAFFIRPNTDETLRITGHLELFDDEDLCCQMSYRGKPAILVMRLHIERAFFHCLRSFRRAELWNPERWPAPMHVKWGRIVAESLNQKDPEAIKEIDAAVDALVDDAALIDPLFDRPNP